jgi:hypothetical protein
MEASAAQSHRGNVTWKEDKNVIVQLWEAQRLEGEGHKEYPGEDKEVEQEVCVALALAKENKS